MLVTSIVLYIGLISSRHSTVATISFSVPDAVAVGASPIVTWTAAESDPEEFTLLIGEETLQNINKIANVNRTAGQTTGVATIPPLSSPGTYYVAALLDGATSPLAVSDGIQVRNPTDSSAPVLVFIVIEHTPTISTIIYRNTNHCSQFNYILTAFSESQLSRERKHNRFGTGFWIRIKVMQTSSSHGLTTKNSIHPSIVTASPSPTNPSLSTMSHNMPSRIPIIVGGTLGVIVVLMMTMGLLVIRHRRSRLLNIPVSPYELSRSEDAGAQSQMLRGVLNWQKRYLQINNPTDITGNGAEIPSEKATIAPELVPSEDTQTEQQQSLQPQAVEMQRQLADSEAALNNMTEASALITENIQLKAEIQVLRDLNRSDWALGLTDLPPPSYPHSETSSI
ncbi:hypothetical protein C8J56DRAFT_1129694 [Mycena floridula]|nr:hypothetical protein C8J56DRAFT_1129694 [Mycena floridula]